MLRRLPWAPFKTIPAHLTSVPLLVSGVFVRSDHCRDQWVTAVKKMGRYERRRVCCLFSSSLSLAKSALSHSHQTGWKIQTGRNREGTTRFDDALLEAVLTLSSRSGARLERKRERGRLGRQRVSQQSEEIVQKTKDKRLYQQGSGDNNREDTWWAIWWAIDQNRQSRRNPLSRLMTNTTSPRYVRSTGNRGEVIPARTCDPLVYY